MVSCSTRSFDRMYGLVHCTCCLENKIGIGNWEHKELHEWRLLLGLLRL